MARSSTSADHREVSRPGTWRKQLSGGAGGTLEDLLAAVEPMPGGRSRAMHVPLDPAGLRAACGRPAQPRHRGWQAGPSTSATNGYRSKTGKTVQQHPQVSGRQPVQAHREVGVMSCRSHSRRACGPSSRATGAICRPVTRDARAARDLLAVPPQGATSPAAGPLRSSRDDGKRRAYAPQRGGRAPGSMSAIILCSARHDQQACLARSLVTALQRATSPGKQYAQTVFQAQQLYLRLLP